MSQTDSWIKVLKEKASEIELLASWASIVDYGKVHDYLRMARHELLRHARLRQEILDSIEKEEPAR